MFNCQADNKWKGVIKLSREKTHEKTAQPSFRMAPEEEPTVHDELTSVTWRSHSAVISRKRTWAAEGLTDIASSSFEAATERQMESDCQIIMQTTSHISFLCSSGLRNLLKLQI